jgi:hypothetical protein
MNIPLKTRRRVAAYPYFVYLSDTHVVEVKQGGLYIGIYLITSTSRRRGVVLPLQAWVALQNCTDIVNLAIDYSQGIDNDNTSSLTYDGKRLDGPTGEWSTAFQGPYYNKPQNIDQIAQQDDAGPTVGCTLSTTYGSSDLITNQYNFTPLTYTPNFAGSPNRAIALDPAESTSSSRSTTDQQGGSGEGAEKNGEKRFCRRSSLEGCGDFEKDIGQMLGFYRERCSPTPTTT